MDAKKRKLSGHLDTENGVIAFYEVLVEMHQLIDCLAVMLCLPDAVFAKAQKFQFEPVLANVKQILGFKNNMSSEAFNKSLARNQVQIETYLSETLSGIDQTILSESKMTKKKQSGGAKRSSLAAQSHQAMMKTYQQGKIDENQIPGSNAIIPD